MDKEIYQWAYRVEGLIPDSVKLKRNIWLKKNEILLEKKDEKLHIYVLGGKYSSVECEEIVLKYLHFSSLVSSNVTSLTAGSGLRLESSDQLAPTSILTLSLKPSMPENVASAIQPHAPKFVRFISELHEKYIEVVSENEFMEIAMSYFHESESKSVFSNSGLIDAVVSLEALFNEGPNDITYKLALRASLLLGMCEIQSVDAFKKFQKIYKARSKLVHGSSLGPENPVVIDLPGYCRKLIIVFLILLSDKNRRKIGKHKRKKSLLTEIDYAALDNKKYIELQKEIAKGLKKFELKVKRSFEVEGFRATPW